MLRPIVVLVFSLPKISWRLLLKTADTAEARLMEETAPPIPSAPAPWACTRSHRLADQVSYSAHFQSVDTLGLLVVLDSASAPQAYTLNLYIGAPKHPNSPPALVLLPQATVSSRVYAITTSNLMSLKATA